MRKIKNRYWTLAAVGILTLSACNSDDTLSADHQGNGSKTPIELTAGIVGEGSSAETRGVTRTVTVTLDNNANNKALKFGSGTSLYMVIKSVDNTDANATYTRTIGYGREKVVKSGDDGKYNTRVDFADAYKRYWEDSHSRDSRISLFSVCVPGYYLAASKASPETPYSETPPDGTVDATTWEIGGSTDYGNTWASDKGTTTIAWPLRGVSVANQTATNGFVDNQDLCYSNNIDNPAGGTDSRIKFDEVTSKFTSGRMVFYHALTKVTFKIKKGDGFGDDFNFSNPNENIVMKGFNTTGTLNFTTGEFSSVNTTTINELAVGDADGDYVHVLTGLMLPGSALTSTATNEIYFTIDNNKYHITKAQLATALSGKKLRDTTTDALDGSNMRPGVHYIFTMTLGKQKLDKLTAAVVPWEIVTAEETTPSNARITMTLLDDKGVKKTGTADFNLYRAANVSGTIDDSYESYTWTTGYTASGCKATLTENTANTGIYTANDATDSKVWYWPDNKTFYHFRTVMPTSTTVNAKTASTEGDYLTLTGAPYITGYDGNYTDVRWGAPFYKYTQNNSTSTAVTKVTYSTSTGFDNETGSYHQISKAIGPTTSQINMTMFHMMSDVTINLTTSSGDDKVTLDGATMEMKNVYNTGYVLMGNGLVKTSGSTTTVNNIVSETKYSPWHYGFVPQSLTGVDLVVTTADNNQYVIDMETIKAAAANVSSSIIDYPYTLADGKYTINAWYPNYKYTYTFKLTKTGITQITATLADWETVEADEDVVQIK